jgi:hypothetical protein
MLAASTLAICQQKPNTTTIGDPGSGSPYKYQLSQKREMFFPSPKFLAMPTPIFP